MEILTNTNILEIQADPKLNSIEAYRNYYNDKMKTISDKRKKFIEESEAQTIYDMHSELNRYNNVVPMIHTQPGIGYFNGNVIGLGNYEFLVTQAPIDLDQYY